jgi:glucosyl-dolichyl phosphate glucuronosyltransferase
MSIVCQQHAPVRGASRSTLQAVTVPHPETVSVVICAYADHRWESLVESVGSVRAQTRRPDEMIVIIDHNPALLGRSRGVFRDATVVANQGARGLSGSRNTGVAVASGEVIAFLDDDARARRDWLAELIAPYSDARVVGTGGAVDPRWVGGRVSNWLPREFYWTVGCSYRGLPTHACPIRNPIGANMSFRREAILRAGGFREGVGRVGAVPLGCEETEMAVKLAQALPGALIVHAPAARVDHRVHGERARVGYFVARCWGEGRSKATITRHVGRAGMSSERNFVLRTLPRGIFLGLREALQGDAAGLARASAIVAGLTITVVGYARGRVRG